MKQRLISVLLVFALLCACLPQLGPRVHAQADIIFELADTVELGKTYVIVADGKYALTNRQEGPALHEYADDAETTLASASVTVADGVLTGEINGDMLWTVVESTAPAAYDGMEQYFLQDPDGNYLRRGSGSLGKGAQLLAEPELYTEKLRFNTWSFYPYGDGTFAVYANSERAYGRDYPYYLYATETSFDSPSSTTRTASDPFAFVDYDDCSRIQLFEAVGYAPCTHEYEQTVVPPTCTEQGYTLHVCAKCGNSYKTDYVYELLHDWPKQGEITEQPTETERGVLTFTCTRCGATKTRPLAAGTEKAHKNEILFISDVHSGKNAENGYHNLRAMFRLLREYDDFIPEVVSGGGDYLESRTYDDVDWPHCIEAMQEIMYETSPDTAQVLAAGNHEWEWSLMSDEMIEKLFGSPRAGLCYTSDDFEIFHIGAHTNDSPKEEFLDGDIAKLRSYLASVEGSGKVIFIQTHWPLHYGYNSDSWRTTKNADVMIDLLNEYAETTDICFIWGHNHNEDKTRHKCMVSGDEMEYAKGKTKQIRFTYVNAGCLNERHAKEGGVPENDYYGPGYLLEARIEGDRLILDYGHITGAWPDPTQAVYDHNADLLYVEEIQEARPSHHEIQLLHTSACEHEYQQTVTPPTCTEGGYTTFTCTKCGKTYVDAAVDPLGHDLISHEAKAPTCTEIGWEAYETCRRCSYSSYEALPAGGHQPGTAVKEHEIAPTCTKPGSFDEVVYCTVCGAELRRDPIVIEASGHSYALTGWIWSGYDAATATFTCANDSGHVQTVKAEIVPRTSEPTCETDGVIEYTAVVSFENASYTDTRTRVIEHPGHAYTAAVTPPTCTEGGFTVYTCSRCGESYKADETAALGHDWDEGTVTTEPTQTEPGVRTHICRRCGETKTARIPELSHVHDYNAVVTAPTCTEKGFTTYTCSCGESYRSEETDALGHDYRPAVTEPTCTEGGYTTYTCSRCGESYTADETAALTHNYADGVCTRCGMRDPDYVPPEDPVDKAALSNAVAAAEAMEKDSFTEASLAALEEAVKAARAVLGDAAATQAAVDAAVRAVQDAVDALEKKPDAPAFRFDDVKDEGKFYFTPVYWAYEAEPQITNGKTVTLFGPDDGCTRGQVVTFLWRAAGCPEPKSAGTPFTDLKEGGFYGKAVAWAVENEITNGMSATTFAPDATCTRGQIVTFLWRFAGQVEPKSTKTDFTDVPDSAFYAKAVAWAVENKVTNGMTPTTFVPGNTCTRGQVVTFLYRAVGE